MVQKEKRVNDVIRIAYVGYKAYHKGWEIFKKIVSQYKHKYKFYCFGKSDDFIPNVEYIEVSFKEDEENAMIKKLSLYNIDVSLLWSICPETYCYTYYESWAAHTFIITNELSGNIATQVQLNRNGIVLKNYEELDMLLDNKTKLERLIKDNKSTITNLKNNEEDILKILNK